MINRWKLTIEYDGRPFSGWQRQEAGIHSIQEEIEKALYAFCQQKIVVHVAGRTDAGVHAEGQVCHFDLDYADRAIDGYSLAKALNALLRPHPIAILNACLVPPDFHARFDARNKLYRYRILNRQAPPALLYGQVWHIYHPLQLEKMQKGAQHLIGHHDFSSFRAIDCQAKTPLRTLEKLDFSVNGVMITCETEARSFLHHQVRNMVGTLVQVGLGKLEADDIKTILAAKDRKAAGPTAPPDGLSLMRIDYNY